jgi:hypothetical protein
MKIKISRNVNGNPPGKIADAEIHFVTGLLEGLKLIGFGVWERRPGKGRNVTFPARQYSVNGERRSFALLRPIMDAAAQDRIRNLILAAYDADQIAHEDDDPHCSCNDCLAARIAEEQRAVTDSAAEPLDHAPARRPFKWAPDPPAAPVAPQQKPIDF